MCNVDKSSLFTSAIKPIFCVCEKVCLHFHFFLLELSEFVFLSFSINLILSFHYAKNGVNFVGPNSACGLKSSTRNCSADMVTLYILNFNKKVKVPRICYVLSLFC